MQRSSSEPGRSSPRRRPNRADAFAIARRGYLAGEKLDVRAMAQELGVSRQTIYRWTGGRDALLAEVAWEVADVAWRGALDAAEGRGVNRIVDAIGHHMRAMVASAPYSRLLVNEGQSGLGPLTTARATFQRRQVQALQQLLLQESLDGHLRFDGDPALLAHTIVRLGDAFTYNDLAAGVEPDIPRAQEMIRLVLAAARPGRAAGAASTPSAAARSRPAVARSPRRPP
jgi:AcrR family transcriptional regulator